MAILFSIASRTGAEPPLPNLTLAQLEYLTAVADAPTWTAAAASIGVSTSALSQGLSELERRLGLALFERDGRRRALTAAAGEVVAYARGVVTQTRELAGWADRVRRGTAGRLRVGMIDAAAVEHFATVLQDLRRDRPGLALTLAVAPSAALLDDLERGRLDVVVCVEPRVSRPGLAVCVLGAEPLAVYGPSGARAGPPERWGPWVTFPPGSFTRAVIAEAVRAAGGHFEVVAESHQPEVLRQMVKLGLGWTVLPAVQVGREDEGLRRMRREPLTHRRLVLARRSPAVADGGADALAAALRAAAVGALAPLRS